MNCLNKCFVTNSNNGKNGEEKCGVFWQIVQLLDKINYC